MPGKSSFTTHHHTCDVLCAGGGIVGLMAAISAAESGADVLVVEKSHVKRSGSGGLGNDHFICYIPEVHGDYDRFIADVLKLQNGPRLRQMGPKWARHFFDQTYEVVKLWDAWGIPMKHNGEYYFSGHAAPGRTRAFLKYKGRDQKLVLTKEAQKRGAKILNRIMIYDLLKDKAGRLIGAVGVSTRDYEIHVFSAKTVILGTGHVGGVYPNKTVGAPAMRMIPRTLTADGRMMAFRAGAALCNLEMPNIHAGIKYFNRGGQATWTGVLRDPAGAPVGPYVDKPQHDYGDITIEVNKNIFNEYADIARGPVYMDFKGSTQQEIDDMRMWLSNEGNSTLVRHLDEEGVDLMTHAVEFESHGITLPLSSGIVFNEKAETTLPGLYAAGDEGYGGMAGAAVFGRIAGQEAAAYAKKQPDGAIGEAAGQVKACEDLFQELLGRANPAHWTEANSALEQTMQDYCGYVRSQTMLDAGLAHLRRVRAHVNKELGAENPHELMYCLGALNMYDLGELIFLLAEDRKESRANFKRHDYTMPDVRLDEKRHIISQKDGQIVLEWR